MKVLQIVPAPNTAITTLAKHILTNNKKKCEIKILSFHPKKPGQNEKNDLQSFWNWADLIDVQYWKSGAKIREMYPSLWKTKPKLLTHHNPYNLHEEKWEDYRKVCVVNKHQNKELPGSIWVPLCIDLEFFSFNPNYTKDFSVNMSVARIEGKKGCLEVAKACNELGVKFNLVGRVSDGGYIERVKAAGGKHLNFKNDVSDDDVKKSYYDSAVHICHSVDNFESGTLPILEAMACGTPVLTRSIGHVPDIYNGSNLFINPGAQDDVETLKKKLIELRDSYELRLGMRQAARDSIKHRCSKWRSEEYFRIYKECLA